MIFPGILIGHKLGGPEMALYWGFISTFSDVPFLLERGLIVFLSSGFYLGGVFFLWIYTHRHFFALPSFLLNPIRDSLLPTPHSPKHSVEPYGWDHCPPKIGSSHPFLNILLLLV